MKIYINNEEVKGNIMPVNKPTLDETLETFSFALISSTNETPYAPMTDVIFEDDSGVKTPFVITIDSVEVFSSNPIRYKHSLTCVQSTRKLSKHLIRNSCFSQPANMTKQSFTAGSLTFKHIARSGEGERKDQVCYYDYPWGIDTSTMQDGSEPLSLATNERILNGYVQVDCKAITVMQQKNSYFLDMSGKFTTYTYMAELRIALANASASCSFGSTFLIFRYCKSGGSYKQSNISPSDLGLTSWDDLVFGRKYNFPRIKELAELGYNNFYFVFPNNASDMLNIQGLYPYVDDEETYFAEYPGFITFHLKFIADTYNYSGRDILIQISNRYRLPYEVDIPSGYTYEGYTGTSAYISQRDELWDGYENWTEAILDDYIPPNLTFTQCTAYECVAEVFRGLDATFTFGDRTVGTYTYSGALKIEYLNDWSGDKVSPRFSGIQLALSEDNYNNSLVSYYQDGRVSVKTSWLPIRSRELCVPQENDHGIIVPSPINSIHSVKCVVSQCWVQTSFQTNQDSVSFVKIYCGTTSYELDLSHYIVADSIWSVLDTTNNPTFDNPHLLYQANTAPFTPGDTFINLGITNSNWLGQKIYILPYLSKCAYWRDLGIWGNITNADDYKLGTFATKEWKNVYFSVEYESTSNGRVVLESLESKYMGESLVDQYNGAVDMNKMGLNMLGLSLKMGQPSLICNHTISKWAKRIKQGQIYFKDGDYWLANVCSYTILPNGMMQGSISFVKNFNSLSLQTRLSRARRLSNISSSLTTLSEDNLINYVYVDTNQVSTYSRDITTSPIAILPDELGRGIQGTFDNPSVFSLNSKHPKQAVIKTDKIDNYVYIPLIKYGLGNSVCFEMAFNHPMNAGNQTTADNSGWFGATAYFTRATKYTDDYGYFTKCNIRIGYADNTTQIYPVLEGSFNSLININNLHIYKQPNEVFALNYQLCFLPCDILKDLVMPEFVNKNYFIDPDNHSVFVSSDENTKFRFYYDKDSEGHKYSQLDVKAITNSQKDNYVRIIGISRTTETSGQYCGMTTLKFTLSAEIRGTYSWAITDINGNVYIASNNYMQGNCVVVRFLPLQKRI